MKSSLRWLVILFGVLAVAWFSYRLGQGDLFVQGKEGWELGLTFADDSPGWSVHQDPSGFAIEVPDGWGARADGASGRAVVIGPLGEQVVIWPVFAAGARGLPAPVVLQQLAAEVFPKASWGAPWASGPGSAAQYGRDGERSLAAGFAAVVSPRGVAGTFYCVAAPPESFGRDNETFTRILQSFKAAGPEAGGQGQAPPARRYVRWSDPSENAFSVEVPADWRTEGGLLRLAPVDTRTAFSVTSPDGAVRIVAGDSRIPNFGVPNQTLAFTGFNEGSWYSPGYGVNMMIRRFVPGTAFAAEYVQSQVAQACGGLRIDGSRDRPDAVAAIDRISQQYGAYGVSVRTTAGEV